MYTHYAVSTFRVATGCLYGVQAGDPCHAKVEQLINTGKKTIKRTYNFARFVLAMNLALNFCSKFKMVRT